ncbi:serine hydrolase domain-containing protein [Sedimentitalea sp. JM2-8]|uniref:Serine hydrolase domain-containing protein n=1 Tax=Sedimentitalea xiamensis TaxID=3050037 RepID=A0ABT7FLF9_9RHOB|nr:serine hydrolase domain-containing protein [Sedimentitalea xiamensis]MDK3075569.1 serine hydrolase domain-containing protein [Sedimentitalea xiamensis]
MHVIKLPVASALILGAFALPALAQDNPLQKYLSVPGAMTTLPVEAAKEPWSLQFSRDARAAFENFHYQMGGDHALYYQQNLSEMLPTAYAAPHSDYIPLERAIDDSIGENVRWTTSEGEMPLSEYIVHPNHRVQGMMMIHKGKVVYEQYPGMNQMDRHAWMSPGKATVGLILALLEEEGKLDMSKDVVNYVPQLAGTNWDGISVLDAANMETGLALEETLDAIIDPSSIIVRFFAAEFGSPNPLTGEMENWLDILKTAEKLEGEEPGEVFRYSSAVTQVSVLLAENLDNMTWADLFQERVWGKVGAREDIMFHLMPDGTAVTHGLISTTLEDFGRFGLLFTPSWAATAHEDIVSDAVLERMQTAGNPEAFRRGAKFAGLTDEFGEEPKANSLQWDAVFEDGALYKHGNVGQGLYVDPARDFVGVYFSTNGYIPPYGEDRAQGFLRQAAKYLGGE